MVDTHLGLTGWLRDVCHPADCRTHGHGDGLCECGQGPDIRTVRGGALVEQLGRDAQGPVGSIIRS